MAFGDKLGTIAHSESISQGKNTKATGGGADNLPQTVAETMNDLLEDNLSCKCHFGLVFEGPDAYLMAGDLLDTIKEVYVKYDVKFTSSTMQLYFNEEKKEEKNGRDHPPKSGDGKNSK